MSAVICGVALRAIDSGTRLTHAARAKAETMCRFNASVHKTVEHTS
jgi:hypothetical protein